ncbi:7-carboxy-7-deazaguanine synthase QueE [Flammeovirgaceae bacterium SG7u.111]|nr:7-carboxy-7-deazaguanine synthase QueE [Flammeovirgaceae bacterium SG7u.132]WPO34525.1 7-carboxy-7-deazaguanine synthase QueE [Flammeovirgaceae bacterium SG7u.111]
MTEETTIVKQEELVAKGLHLPVMEAFYTIQGEGCFQGNAAYFIRLAGCDVGCVWCDVKESWDADLHPVKSVEEIVAEAAKHPARLAIITGGEPLMYDLTELTKALKKEGFRIHIETSGAHPLSGQLDWVTFSPKKFKKPLKEVCKQASELKIIVFNKSDFAWAKEHAALVGEKCRLFLQPEWSKTQQMMPLIVEFVKENPNWQVSLQTHKFMDIP